jgi:hypothetical protein
MSKVLTFLPASFPMLAKLFYPYRCLLFLCFSLVLFLLFLRVKFGFSLVPFWGYLSLILCALVYFIGSFEPSKMRLGKPFAYPLTKLLKTQWMN